MRSGSLRESLVFQQKTETMDSFGTPVQTWATAFTVPGSFAVSPGTRSNSEFDAAQKRSTETTGLFKIRFRSGVVGSVGSLRILWDSRYWDIRRAEDPDGRLREIHIEADWIE